MPFVISRFCAPYSVFSNYAASTDVFNKLSNESRSILIARIRTKLEIGLQMINIDNSANYFGAALWKGYIGWAIC